MEPSQENEVSDDEWAPEWQWAALDDTMILVGLLLFQASLFKSGYSAEVMTELQARVAKLIRYYERKGQ